jgi:hypothetical protein
MRWVSERISPWGLAALLLLTGVILPAAASHRPGVDARVDRIFRGMSEYLRETGEFVFEAKIAYDDILPSGQKIQYAADFTAAVVRPDKVWTSYRGDTRTNRTFYDGKTFVLYQPEGNVYAVWEAPSRIDDLIDRANDELRFGPPLSDLLYSDLYRAVEEKMTVGHYAGLHSVDGIPTHHLVYGHEDLDWQVWVEDGPRPLLRKMVITFKNLPQAPQFSATISKWDLSPRLSQQLFIFEPPQGSRKITFVPSGRAGENRLEGGDEP